MEACTFQGEWVRFLSPSAHSRSHILVSVAGQRVGFFVRPFLQSNLSAPIHQSIIYYYPSVTELLTSILALPFCHPLFKQSGTSLPIDIDFFGTMFTMVATYHLPVPALLPNRILARLHCPVPATLHGRPAGPITHSSPSSPHKNMILCLKYSHLSPRHSYRFKLPPGKTALLQFIPGPTRARSVWLLSAHHGPGVKDWYPEQNQSPSMGPSISTIH